VAVGKVLFVEYSAGGSATRPLASGVSRRKCRVMNTFAVECKKKEQLCQSLFDLLFFFLGKSIRRKVVVSSGHFLLFSHSAPQRHVCSLDAGPAQQTIGREESNERHLSYQQHHRRRAFKAAVMTLKCGRLPNRSNDSN
jgi:hypothetical protein